MLDAAKKRSALLGASLGIAGTLTLVVLLGLAAGAGAGSKATPPSNTSPPTISGTDRKGETLHADPGSWTGSQPIQFAYRWQRCNQNGANCSNISGATHRDYVLGSADVGRTVRVVVTASNSAGQSTAASSPSAVIADAQRPANTASPTITGAAQLGSTLSASPGGWNGPGPITFTFQWERCDQFGDKCSFVSGAVNQTYVVASADVGHAMRIRVQARNQFGRTFATSAPTAAVSATANGCPIGAKTVQITQIGPPARLLVDGMHFDPAVLTRNTKAIVARFHVSDTCAQSVQGALVYADAIPYNQVQTASEVSTDSTGWATLVFHMKKGYPASKNQQLLALFVRARKGGENPLAGVSTRRLVSIRVVK
jgi:hypothetical protein